MRLYTAYTRHFYYMGGMIVLRVKYGALQGLGGGLGQKGHGGIFPIYPFSLAGLKSFGLSIDKSWC